MRGAANVRQARERRGCDAEVGGDGRGRRVERRVVVVAPRRHDERAVVSDGRAKRRDQRRGSTLDRPHRAIRRVNEQHVALGFPEIAAVRCLPHTRSDGTRKAGSVGVLVLPDRPQEPAPRPSVSLSGRITDLLVPLTPVGASVAVVAKTLGHENVATTSTYLHAMPGEASGDSLDPDVWAPEELTNG